MFFPYSTDAPVYYRPWGTVGLIAPNTVVHGLSESGVIEAGEPCGPDPTADAPVELGCATYTGC